MWYDYSQRREKPDMEEKALLKKIIDIPQYGVKEIYFKEGDEKNPPQATIVLERDEMKFKCSCGYETTSHYDRKKFRVRDFPCGQWSVIWLEFYKHRIQCPRHGIVTEELEWIRPRKAYTTRLYYAVVLSCREYECISDVVRQYHLGWDIVKSIDEKDRKKAEILPGDRDIEYLIITEFHAQRRHIITFTNPISYNVIYIGNGDLPHKINFFFGRLLEDRCKKIKAICIAAPYSDIERKVKRHCPNADIVNNLFQLYSKLFGNINEMPIVKKLLSR